VIRAPQQPERLPHGYTNLTTLEGGRVIKRYAGPDAALRRDAEVRALTALAGRFPVPAAIGQDDSQLTLSFVPGVPGQEILEQRPHDVLFAVGRAGRALHGLDVSATYEIVGGAVLVHGDFGPQNMVFDAKTLQPAAVVDWEFAHPGDAVEDLAWAEWIIRTHHPRLIDSLGTMFEGYGGAHPGGSGMPRCSRNADGPLTSFVAGREPTRHRSRCGSGGWRLRRISGSEVEPAGPVLAGFAL
jgi:tRNA A-37 threonylcarbamoyl transferase component Bud32